MEGPAFDHSAEEAVARGSLGLARHPSLLGEVQGHSEALPQKTKWTEPKGSCLKLTFCVRPRASAHGQRSRAPLETKLVDLGRGYHTPLDIRRGRLFTLQRALVKCRLFCRIQGVQLSSQSRSLSMYFNFTVRTKYHLLCLWLSLNCKCPQGSLKS